MPLFDQTDQQVRQSGEFAIVGVAPFPWAASVVLQCLPNKTGIVQIFVQTASFLFTAAIANIWPFIKRWAKRRFGETGTYLIASVFATGASFFLFIQTHVPAFIAGFVFLLANSLMRALIEFARFFDDAIFFNVLNQTGDIDSHVLCGIARRTIYGKAFAYFVNDFFVVSLIF